MIHHWIFHCPSRNTSFTFRVDPIQIASLKPRQRARCLKNLSKQLEKSAEYLCNPLDGLTATDLEFATFRLDVMDFAASGVGVIK